MWVCCDSFQLTVWLQLGFVKQVKLKIVHLKIWGWMYDEERRALCTFPVFVKLSVAPSGGARRYGSYPAR
jgi:hypothetical protein